MVREDSQIHFATGNVFLHVFFGGIILFFWGGGGFYASQILATTDFFKHWKTLSARKNIISKITINQTSRLNLDKFGGGNYIPDCRSAPFA